MKLNKDCTKSLMAADGLKYRPKMQKTQSIFSIYKGMNGRYLIPPDSIILAAVKKQWRSYTRQELAKVKDAKILLCK